MRAHAVTYLRGLATSALLIAALTACGGDATPDRQWDRNAPADTEGAPEETEAPLGEAEVRARDGGLVTRLYEGAITLSDGRTIKCVVGSRGAPDCDWGSPSPELEQQLAEMLESKAKKPS